MSGTGERALESLLQAALRQLVSIQDYPRCVFQVTLQVLESPENVYVNTKLTQAQLVGFSSNPGRTRQLTI